MGNVLRIKSARKLRQLSSQGQPSWPTHQLRPRPPRLRRIILNFLKGNWVGLLLLAADLSGYWYDRSFLLQDLHFNGCDGLVALPGGFEAFPRHCVDLPVLNALFRVFCLLRQAYKVLQSSFFLIKKKKKKKKQYHNFKLIKYKFFHCLLT